MKRLLSLLLCLSMLLSLAPVNAVFAESTVETADRAVVTLATPTGVYAPDYDVAFNAVTVYWNPVDNATGYEVQYRPVSETTWTTFGTASTESMLLYGLTCGQEYYFRVRAVADTGSEVSYSQYSAITRQTPRPAMPGIYAEQNAVTSIQLAWSEVKGAQGYNIYRSENGGAFTLLKTFTGYTVYDYVDSGLTVGNTYMYEICGWRDMNGIRVEGVRAMSSEIKILPLAPDGVKATVASATGVKLTWNAVPGADSYKVYRANSSGGAYSCIASNVTGVSYTDSGLLTGATYYYYVTTVVGSAESDPSKTVSSAPELLPPANFKVAATTNNSIKLTWDSVPLASGYRLYFSNDGVNWSSGDCINLTDSDVTYTFTGLNPSTPYYFQIYAYVTLKMTSGSTDEMVSNGSMIVTAYTNPTTPADLAATVTGFNSVELTWSDIGENVDGYEIYRSTDKKNYTLIATVGNEYSYHNIGITCGTTFAYKIRAFKKVNVDGTETTIYSQYSSVVTAKPVPNAPGFVDAWGLDGTSIKVIWEGESGADDPVNGATGYYVYYRVKGENDFVLGADVDGGSTLSTVLNNMTPGVEMEIRVCAYRTVAGKKIAGKFSGIVVAMAMPVAPTNVTTGLVDEKTLTVSWTGSKGADGYDLYMWYEPKVYEEPSGGYMSLSRAEIALEDMTFVVSTAETSHTVTGLVPGYLYYFRVVPFVEGADGPVTGPASATSAGNFPRPKKPATFTGTALSIYEAKLNWTATAFVVDNLRGYEISYSVDGAQNWIPLIDVNDPAATSYVHEGRDENATYMYRIRSYVYSDGKKVYSVYTSAVSVAPKPTMATNLKTASNAVDTITLTFSGEMDPVRYQVFRSTNASSGFAKIGVVIGATTPEDLYYDDTTAKVGTTYYYRLRPLYIATDGTLYYGDYSAVVSGMSKPAVPENLKATSSGVTSAWVSWNKVDGATGYQVYRSKSENSGFQQVKSLSSSYNSFNDTGLVCGQTYYYRVRAYVTVNGTNIYGAFCDPVKYACEPKSPANFAIASTTYNSATLTWKAVEGAASFTLKATYVDYEGVTRTQTKEVDGAKTSATMSGFPMGVNVTFEIVTNVVLDDSVISSDPAATVSGTIKPGKVTGLTGTSVSTASNTLKWNAVEGALYYIVRRSDTGENGTFTDISGQIKGTSYIDTTVTTGQLCYYRVVAVSSMPDGTPVEGWPSDKVKLVSTPATPTGLAVKSTAYNRLRLDWDASAGAEGYQIYRSTKKDSGFTLIATTADNFYADIPITCGVTYYYKVRAYVTSGTEKYYSAYTGVVSGKPVPPQVKGVTVIADTTTSAKVTWQKTAGATGYQLWYKADTTTTWTNAGSLTALTKTVTGLTAGVTYQFKVRAYRTVDGKNVFGPYSAVVALTQLPPTPQGVTTANVNSNSIKVSWKACTGVAGYEVHISTSETGTYTLKADVKTTNATLTGLEIGVRVYVKVRAYGLDGKGNKVYGDFSAVAYRMPRPVAPKLQIASWSITDGVTLKWNAIPDATGYVIYRKFGASGTFEELTRVTGSSIVSYRDTGVSGGDFPYYMIHAMSQTTDPGLYVFSVDSNVVYQKLTPKAPTLSVKTSTSTTITLTWTDVGADKYVVRRATAKNGEYYVMGTFTGTTWTDDNAGAGLKMGKTYYYKVFALSQGSEGNVYAPASNIVSRTVTPGKVQNVKATLLTFNGAKITWDAVDGATGYEIYARTGSKTAARKLVATVDGGAKTSKNVYGLTCGKTVYIEVRAKAGSAAGAFSAQAGVQLKPTKVSGVTAKAIGGKQVKLTWNKVEGATGYIVLRSTAADGTFKQVGTTTKLTLTLTKQDAGVQYYYKVRAYRTVSGTQVLGIMSNAIGCTPEP